MNDNDIIKALECCKKDDCDNCPNDFGNCYSNLAGYALEIINRLQAENQSQKAKIEALQMDYQQLKNDIVNANMNADHTLEENEQLKSEIEKLKKINDTFSDIGKMYSEIKAEVIKEFADNFLERVHDNHYVLQWKHNTKDCGMFTIGIEQCVNEIKKEMGCE